MATDAGRVERGQIILAVGGWTGLRPMTADGMSILGRLPGEGPRLTYQFVE